VSEALGVKDSTRANPAWLAVPLVAFALVALTLGLVARQTVREPYTAPFFHPFFTDTLHMKAWLVTVAMVLACGQLVTAARIYELLPLPPRGRFYSVLHRWSGRAAIVLTLPVAYHVCSCSGSRHIAFASSSTRCWDRRSMARSSRRCSSSGLRVSRRGSSRRPEVSCSRSSWGSG